MKLVHFSEEPLVRIVDSKPTLARFDERLKPSGLWVSDEDDYGWRQWCMDEHFHVDRLRCATEIELENSPRVLILDSLDAIKRFDRRYGEVITLRADFSSADVAKSESMRFGYIDWRLVAQDYGAVVISPYQRRLRLERLWYYGWDCASGCIWEASLVRRFAPLQIPKRIGRSERRTHGEQRQDLRSAECSRASERS